MDDQLFKERGKKERLIVDRWQRNWGDFVKERRELWRQMREATQQRDASRRFKQGLPMDKQALPTPGEDCVVELEEGEEAAGRAEAADAHHGAPVPTAEFPAVPRTTAAEIGWLAAHPEWQVEIYGPCVRQPRWPEPPPYDPNPGI